MGEGVGRPRPEPPLVPPMPVAVAIVCSKAVVLFLIDCFIVPLV